MAGITDDDLVRLYCDGDSEAFEVLFDRHHAAVYNLARLMLGDAGWAEEVLQETFLAVAEGLKHYTAAGRFRPWLMRIVRNRCLNRLEAERRRRAALAAAGLTSADPPDRSAGPAEQSGMNEEVETIRAAIADLPDRQREAIALYALHEMTYREIAEVTGAPINTIKTLIRRARAALAERLTSLRREEQKHGV
jgi:RNA polymerase sigma-70 factor (ECF subfamily)